MRNATACILCVLLSAIQTVAADTKYHQTVWSAPGSPQSVARFTVIMTHPDQIPLTERILYQDDNNQRLVIRNTEVSEDASGTTTIECLSTGQIVEFEVLVDSYVIARFGSNSVTLNASDMDDFATALPQDLIDQATEVFEDIGPLCRFTLRRLAEIGTHHTSELFQPAVWLSAFMFSDVPEAAVDGSNPPNPDATTDTSEWVTPFDPTQTPPGAFEAPFGAAYYE